MAKSAKIATGLAAFSAAVAAMFSLLLSKENESHASDSEKTPVVRQAEQQLHEEEIKSKEKEITNLLLGADRFLARGKYIEAKANLDQAHKKLNDLITYLEANHPRHKSLKHLRIFKKTQESLTDTHNDLTSTISDEQLNAK